MKPEEISSKWHDYDMIWLWYDMIWKKERTNESMNQWMNQWMTDHHLLYTKNKPSTFMFFFKKKTSELPCVSWRNLLSPISRHPTRRAFFPPFPSATRRYCEANGIQITAYGSIFGGHQIMLYSPGKESWFRWGKNVAQTTNAKHNSTSKKR